MEIVSGDQYEVLSFIDACNSQQHTPPPQRRSYFGSRTALLARLGTEPSGEKTTCHQVPLPPLW